MKKYKTTLTHANCSQLRAVIEWLIQQEVKRVNIEIVALAEVLLILRRKQVEYKPKHKVSFTQVQAMALVWLNEIAGSDFSNDFTNRLLKMSNEINQLYAL